MAKGIYGEGTFSKVANRPNAPIRYRKRILGKYVSVYGKSERECIKKMKEKEAQLHEKEKLMHLTDIEQCALFKDAVLFWLETYKKGKLKGRSFDRNMQIFHTYIEEMPIGRMSIDNIDSNDIQSLLNEVAGSRSQSTVNKAHGLLNQFFKHYYKRDSNNLTLVSDTFESADLQSIAVDLGTQIKALDLGIQYFSIAFQKDDSTLKAISSIDDLSTQEPSEITTNTY